MYAWIKSKIDDWIINQYETRLNRQLTFRGVLNKLLHSKVHIQIECSKINHEVNMYMTKYKSDSSGKLKKFGGQIVLTGKEIIYSKYFDQRANFLLDKVLDQINNYTGE